MMVERGGSAGKVEVVIQKRKRGPRGLSPGTFAAFDSLVAEAFEEAAGRRPEERRFAVSAERAALTETVLPRDKAVALCRRHGYGAERLARLLVKSAVVTPQAFGQLDEDGTEGIVNRLTGKLAPLLALPRRKMR